MLVAERRLSAAQGEERARLARDSYSYLHLPMVAGIIFVALGVKQTLSHVGDPLGTVPAVALCGGVALYLLGHNALNAWCELSVEELSGRCPRSRVGLLPDPTGKGTDSSCSTWTPSSPYSTLWSTTSASLRLPNSDALDHQPPSARARSSPSPSSPAGRDSLAKGTSTAMPRPICEERSLPSRTVPNSTASCASTPPPSRRSP